MKLAFLFPMSPESLEMRREEKGKRKGREELKDGDVKSCRSAA